MNKACQDLISVIEYECSTLGNTKGGGTMARVCEICGKGVTTGNLISKRGNRNKKVIAPNLQSVHAIVGGTPTRIRVCTRCIRSGKVQRAL
jgi:large subunit ribosomal protein L28